jgi:hypothetical protein
MRHGLSVAYGILILGGVWFALMVSGVLRSWALDVSKIVPSWLVLIAVLATPFLAALCSLDFVSDLRARVVALVLLLVSVPLLPLAFDAHPLLVTLIGFGTLLEAYSIPVINRRWLSRRGKGGQQSLGGPLQ